MPNLGAVLKQEIRRLARREVLAELAAVRRTAAQHRRDIARLKRELAAVRRDLAAARGAQARVARSTSDVGAEGKRWNRRGLAAHRKRLGLSAKEYGALIGVTAQTIYHWEGGAQRPRKRQLAAVVAVRGLGKRAALARLAQLDGSRTARDALATSKALTPTTPPRADLVRSLRANGGNVSAVAREYGKLPAQLYRWFRRHKLRPSDYRTQ